MLKNIVCAKHMPFQNRGFYQSDLQKVYARLRVFFFLPMRDLRETTVVPLIRSRDYIIMSTAHTKMRSAGNFLVACPETNQDILKIP